MRQNAFRKLLRQQMELLKVDESFVTRYLNEGFSGGEKKKNEILSHCIEINRLENMGDDITHVAVAGLFKKYDAVEIIKLKEIYEYLEEATDKCEDAADVIKDVFMKNS